MGNIKQYNISQLESYKEANAVISYSDKLYFNDAEIARICDKLKKVVIQSYSFVDGVEFIYEDNISTGIHGNYTGERAEYTLADDEYINYISWETGIEDYYGFSSLEGVVIYIEFRTNKGNVFASQAWNRGSEDWKNRQTFSCCADNGKAILGLAGYAGSKAEWLYSITKVYFKEIEPQFSPNEKYYNDYYYTYNCRRLAKIKIYHGWVVDKIQFVYTSNNGEIDETITEMHGAGDGSLSEIDIAEGEYIYKIIYKSANTDYYSEKIMYSVEFIIKNAAGIERSHKFGAPPSSTLQSWTHKHTYTVQANNGYELFAFAGRYYIYMGDLDTVYQRKLGSVTPKPKKSGRSVLAADNPLNKSDAYILFVNCSYVYDSNTRKPEKDKIANLLCRSWGSWRGQNMRKLKNLYSDDNIDILSDLKLNNAIFLKAFLSGQYKYVSIKAHGFRESLVGPEFGNLLSKTMIEKSPDEFKRALKDMVINLFCCNCAYRNAGLAVTLVKHGAKACYGYSVPLAFVEGSYSFLTDFASFIDNAILIEKKRINTTATLLSEKFDEYLKELMTLHTLKKSVVDELAAMTEKTETEVKNWLKENGHNVERYILGWYMHRNKKYFCGPGSETAKLAGKNFGELCKDFGDSSEYLRDGNWIEHSDL